ncbi:hypothetical protein LJR129_004944 [Acidovorax sp. LjRoot129]|uniref:hypothetical protein n=1 Tax=unclassified Acidovorax TaxID=2684926 RepID=UPI003ECE3B7E
MPLPLIAVIAALKVGGSLVPHAAGGLIVTSAGGYVAGTYLSSAAIYSLVAGTSAVLGAGVLTVTGVASAIIGSAGYFGTTLGASGLTGILMSAGILPATPIVVPVVAGLGMSGGLGYLTYLLLRLRKKLKAAGRGDEVQFTEAEAKIFEALIRRFAKKSGDGANAQT